jgi:hypothetical protein
VVVFAIVAAGCPSLSTYQTAEPTPAGRWRAIAASGLVTFRDSEQQSVVPGAQIEVGARRGLGENHDAGLKLYLFGVAGDVKWRFLRRDAIEIAVVPSLDVARTAETAITTDATHLFGHVALLITRKRSSWPVTLGPKLMYGLYLPRTGGAAQGVAVGGLVNVAIPVAAAGWKLVPEIDLYRSVGGDVPVRGFSFHAGTAIVREF